MFTTKLRARRRVSRATQPASRFSGRSHMTMRSMGAHTAAMCIALYSTAAAQVSCEMWNTAEFFASATGDDVARCIAAGADPNAEDGTYSGRVSLRFAAQYSNSPAVVSALLEAGAGSDPAGADRQPQRVFATSASLVAGGGPWRRARSRAVAHRRDTR